MAKKVIKRVLVEDGTRHHEMTGRILGQVEGLNILDIGRDEATFDMEHGCKMGKDTMHLLSYRGEFLKPCPGTKNYICCGYQILNVATNCPIDCSYCILQSYFNQPNLRVFVNLEEELEGVLAFIDSNPQKIFRVGTGEFTDSLAIDSITGWSDLLIPSFSKRKNAVLELKTKTTEIRDVLDSPFRDRIIISWSLNSPFITSREEHRASGLKQRLKAAQICQQDGYVVGFHFDPLIVHPGWKNGYLRTIEMMEKYLDPERIIWISLGSMRYIPSLKEIIRKRHPGTCILDGEFVQGLDGKMRYFKPIRMELYRFMRENLEKWHPRLGLYLCMESDEIWSRTMGWSPTDSDGLKAFLDGRVMEIFG